MTWTCYLWRRYQSAWDRTTIDLKAIIRREFAENAHQKDFEPELEKAAAKERQRKGGVAGGKA